MSSVHTKYISVGPAVSHIRRHSGMICRRALVRLPTRENTAPEEDLVFCRRQVGDLFGHYRER